MNLAATWQTLAKTAATSEGKSGAHVAGGPDGVTVSGTGEAADLVAKEVVLCADFTVTGRPEAGFPDLVARLDLDPAFWHIVPPSIEPGADIDGAAYVRSWLTPVRESGLRVKAVMGYCVGAVYAAELADAVAEYQGDEPQLIVFDPEQTSMDTIRYQFGNVLGILSSILNDEDVTETQEAVNRLYDTEGMTVGRYASELYETFRAIGQRAFQRAGLDVEYGVEMWGAFSSFLSYLSYADQLDPSVGWRRATAFSSSSAGNGLNRLRGVAGEHAAEGVVARELAFTEGHDELLRSNEVVRTVAELLGK
ncbi:hypothetical protein [Kitasatospora sp. NPDC050463]|uniref:hypothetical protein n=1 Tax=Kitasatospora sp. NPDC050463 TaxID=3155786 RepID=UPI0033D60008